MTIKRKVIIFKDVQHALAVIKAGLAAGDSFSMTMSINGIHNKTTIYHQLKTDPEFIELKTKHNVRRKGILRARFGNTVY